MSSVTFQQVKLGPPNDGKVQTKIFVDGTVGVDVITTPDVAEGLAALAPPAGSKVENVSPTYGPGSGA